MKIWNELGIWRRLWLKELQLELHSFADFDSLVCVRFCVWVGPGTGKDEVSAFLCFEGLGLRFEWLSHE
ncbi:hypothetical protein A2U01_0051020, partial [Trifolium medium]|nr:hypothetical protein [Trifolium medium]